MGKVNEHSAWGGSAYNSGFGVARSPPERGGVLGAVDCTAFYSKYHLHLHAVPVEGRGADSLRPQLTVPNARTPRTMSCVPGSTSRVLAGTLDIDSENDLVL